MVYPKNTSLVLLLTKRYISYTFQRNHSNNFEVFSTNIQALICFPKFPNVLIIQNFTYFHLLLFKWTFYVNNTSLNSFKIVVTTGLETRFLFHGCIKGFYGYNIIQSSKNQNRLFFLPSIFSSHHYLFMVEFSPTW